MIQNGGFLIRYTLRNRYARAIVYYMNKKLTWVDYLNRLPGGPSDRSIAAAAETSPSTVSRWKGGQNPDPMHVVKIARAFDQSPLNALVNAGYLTIDEMDSIIRGGANIQLLSLSDYSNLQLAEELARRLRKDQAL